MQEHPHAALVRRSYEARARNDRSTLAALVDPASVGDLLTARIPLSIAAAGDVAVVIDRRGAELGVAVLRISDGRITGIHRLPDWALS